MDNVLALPEKMCRIETGTEHTLLDDRDVLLCEDHLYNTQESVFRVPQHSISSQRPMELTLPVIGSR